MHPGKERGAEIKTDLGIIIDDVNNHLLMVEDAGGAVAGVTLGGDAFVPIMIGKGGVLNFDFVQPWVFTRRLVKMSVDTNVFVQRGLQLTKAKVTRSPSHNVTSKNQTIIKISLCDFARPVFAYTGRVVLVTLWLCAFVTL